MTSLLGKDWTLEGELAASLRIAAKLDDDRLARQMSCLLATVLFAWVSGVMIAALWCAAVQINEMIEPRVLQRLKTARAKPASQLVPYLVHITIGATIWAIAGVVLFANRDVATLPLALAILIGTLIHASIFYSQSRLQTMLTSVPPILALSGLIVFGFFNDGAPFRDKMLLGTAIVTVIYYLIAAAAQNIRIHDELGELVRHAHALAERDPLTGLKNRRSFVGAVDAALGQGAPVCMVCLDLDRFKPINDQFGHGVGDAVLQAVAARLSSAPDVLDAGRLGGDEFAALVRHDGDGRRLHERLCRLQRVVTQPVSTPSGDVPVGAAFGYAVAVEDGERTADLISGADAAMMRAKIDRTGPGRFDAAIDRASRQSAAMELAFRQALDRGQMRAALQPIARVSDGAIVGHELLARWSGSGMDVDPSPKDFIPIAEKLGLLDRLLWTTLEEVLPVISGQSTCLAINISPSQLNSEAFLVGLKAQLDAHAVVYEQVELEITEEIVFRNLDTNTEMLRRARACGFRIVMDDFGTGYSSLSMLDALPLDKVKLDRAFVSRASAGGHRNDVLGATIRLVKDLRLECCVEGIEDADTARLVRGFGCDLVQGYWIGRPEIVSRPARLAVSPAASRAA